VLHEGSFTMRLGLGGWLLGTVVVRPLFERVVEWEVRGISPGVVDEA